MGDGIIRSGVLEGRGREVRLDLDRDGRRVARREERAVFVEDLGRPARFPSFGFGAEIDPPAFIEGDTERRAKTNGKKGDTGSIGQEEPSPSVGERQESSDHAETAIKEFGITSTLGGMIVEEDDALRQGHASGGPGDQMARTQVLRDIEETKAIQEYGDVAPSDQDSAAGTQGRKDLFALAGDRSPFFRLPTLFKVAVDLFDPAEVMIVEAAEGIEAVESFGFEDVKRTLHLPDPARGFKRVGKPMAVDLLEMASAVLAFAVGVEKVGVFGKDGFTTRVDTEVVDLRLGKGFAYRVILFFAFLPSSRDQGEIPLDPDLFENGGERRFVDLRAKDKEPG